MSMNPFLFEPYNAWQQPPRKKHWHEVIEEEALMARIIAEAQAAAQQVQDTAMAAAGAGGVPPYEYWNSAEVVDFSGLPAKPYNAPVTITFTNLTTTPEGDEYLWLFGDGTTSSDANPTHFYGNTGSYNVTLQVTHSALDTSTSSVKVAYVSASRPVVTSNYTTASAYGDLIGPVTMVFTNTSTNTSYQPTSSYKWTFGDGTTSSLAASNSHSYSNTGSITSSLQLTGSYGLTSLKTLAFVITAPTISVTAFTATSASNIAPVYAVVSASHNYNGHGTVTGVNSVLFGDGYTYSYGNLPVNHQYDTGSFTASLSITESSYNITATAVTYIITRPPNITASFNYNTASGNGVTATGFTASFTSSATYVSSSIYAGTLSGKWVFGDGTTASYAGTTPFTHIYNTGSYTASLSLTESVYNITSNLYTASFKQP